MINHETEIFSNGVRFVRIPNNNTEAVTIFILEGTGGRYENEDQKGISHFLEHLFFKGSANRPSTFAISKELDAIGANYNAFTGEEYTGFYVQSGADDFEKSFDVISDMFLNPLFDKDEIEREKGVILQEANMYHDMPQAYVQILNQKQIFGDHPLGYDLVGDQQQIKKIGQKEIIDYRDKNYSASNTIIIVCGNQKDNNWDRTVRERFEKIPAGSSPKPKPFDDEVVTSRIVEEIRQVDQAHFVLSYLGISKNDHRRYVASVLSNLLGGGMSSRLFMKVRERKGLAYYVKSSVNTFSDTGAFTIFAGVKPESLPEAIKIVLSEIEDLIENGPDEEELERAKGNLRGSLAISLEDSLEIASFASEDLLYLNKIRDLEEIITGIDKVTRDDVKSLAREIFTKNRMALSIIGPKSYNDDLKEIINN